MYLLPSDNTKLMLKYEEKQSSLRVDVTSRHGVC